MTQRPSSVNEQMLTRHQLRQELLKNRRETAPEQRRAWDLRISEQVIHLLSQERPALVAVYWPIKAEPDLLECYQELRQLGMSLALPVVVGKQQALKFVPWLNDNEMELDDFGIPMPRDRTVSVTPDCMLIPCVGFNAQNFRLGYGGGFYDRSLALHKDCKTIGIAYQQAFCDFAADVHDIALQRIITELP